MNKLKHTEELTFRSCVRKKMIHCGNLEGLHIQKRELKTKFKLSEYLKGFRRKYTVINSGQHHGKSSQPMKRAQQIWITWMEKKKSNQMWYEHFHLSFFFCFNFFFFNCSRFCHTLKWNSHGFTCIPHPDLPSHLPLHPIPLGLPSAPGPSACLMHPTWAGDLFHPR